MPEDAWPASPSTPTTNIRGRAKVCMLWHCIRVVTDCMAQESPAGQEENFWVDAEKMAAAMVAESSIQQAMERASCDAIRRTNCEAAREAALKQEEERIARDALNLKATELTSSRLGRMIREPVQCSPPPGRIGQPLLLNEDWDAELPLDDELPLPVRTVPPPALSEDDAPPKSLLTVAKQNDQQVTPVVPQSAPQSAPQVAPQSARARLTQAAVER